MSAVLAFEPAAEADCSALMDMYVQLYQAVPLNHGLTPHVTIAYYRPDENGYGEDVTRALQQVIDEVNAAYRGREIVLSMDALRYCCFTDMNHYCSKAEMMRLRD
ncbi:MAG: hypothetical protein IJ313_07070 [Clostridia bacterium]|nr:hypothetical protein [Clostridia bacterium]